MRDYAKDEWPQWPLSKSLNTHALLNITNIYQDNIVIVCFPILIVAYYSWRIVQVHNF